MQGRDYPKSKIPVDKSSGPFESKGNRASIYRIPEHIKKVNPNTFKPQPISFGPYHHGEFATLKSVADCLLKTWWMRSYDKLDDKWKTKPAKFLELMILDGCLFMQVLLKPSSLWMLSLEDVVRDMLLLENQLPMKLLDKLCSMLMREGEQEHNKVCLIST